MAGGKTGGKTAERLGEAIARRGLMLVLSSPSGAGKTTLSRMLLQDPVVELSISATTRPQRNRTAEPSRAAARMQPVVVRDNATDTQVAASELPVPQPDIVTRPWPRSVGRAAPWRWIATASPRP